MSPVAPTHTQTPRLHAILAASEPRAQLRPPGTCFETLGCGVSGDLREQAPAVGDPLALYGAIIPERARLCKASLSRR